MRKLQPAHTAAAAAISTDELSLMMLLGAFQGIAIARNIFHLFFEISPLCYAFCHIVMVKKELVFHHSL